LALAWLVFGAGVYTVLSRRRGEPEPTEMEIGEPEPIESAPQEQHHVTGTGIQSRRCRRRNRRPLGGRTALRTRSQRRHRRTGPRPSILRQTQPERSDVVAALTDDEATNFAVCMATQRMADVRTVMRVTSEPDDLHSEFVDGIVFPANLGARAAVNEIVGEGVRTVEDVFGDVEVLEVEIAEDAPAAGRTLREVRLPRGSLIVVDYHGNRIGGPETVLEPGEWYVVAVEHGVSDEVMNLLRG
jgi:trk system potassium uptake protein TrkA